MKIQAQAGITILLGFSASLIFTLLKMILNVEISKIFFPILAFPLNFFIIGYLYPRKLKIPFGDISAKEFSQKIGFTTPTHFWKNCLLGILLAMCTLTGMLIASIATGRYVFDINTITIEQVLFSTVPGVWEEVFWRGILMMVLIGYFKEVKKPFIIQSVIFGLAHIHALDLWSMVDLGSVMILGLGFTYIALKTNSLVPGIIFHFLHDAFLFVVQVPGGDFIGASENLIFYGCLWGMVAIGCIITKLASEKFKLVQSIKLYDFTKVPVEEARIAPMSQVG